MAESSTQSLVIRAKPAEVAAVVSDFEAYPQWVKATKRVEVLSRYDDGRAKQVEFELDAGVFKDTYVLEYAYGDERVDWHLVRGETQKSQVGSYVFTATDGGTEVTYSLAVDLTIPMLGMFKRKAEKVIMDTALKELKKRVEG
ncbi:SRPBCC family protein [Fodinicola acaciae]|uniref:SRPBCC family protein n=1 Tax=Fodinicola acaciae TaxID=2681555 RepID=UPI0013D153F9|nr:SRPBCC family protein [Fodinicola acaciae]